MRLLFNGQLLRFGLLHSDGVRALQEACLAVRMLEHQQGLKGRGIIILPLSFSFAPGQRGGRCVDLVAPVRRGGFCTVG